MGRGKPKTNVVDIKQPRRRGAKGKRERTTIQHEITVPRGELPENIFVSQITETFLPDSLHILKGDWAVITICDDVPDGTLACVKRASDGYMEMGFFYREPDGTIRLEYRPRADDCFTVSGNDVESIARVIRIERDIAPSQEGGAL